MTEFDEWGRAVYVVDRDVRCSGIAKNGQRCRKLLLEFATRPYRVRCPRCKTVNEAFPEEGKKPERVAVDSEGAIPTVKSGVASP